MEKILISACLMGQNVRYDGGHCLIKDQILQDWIDEGRLIVICPEMAGGLPAPRPPCEIKEGRVMDRQGNDYSKEFCSGSKQALELVEKYNIKYALLKEQSPSCGVHLIYDGTFTSQKIKGSGIMAQALKKAGVTLFSDEEISKLYNSLS